MAKIRAKLSRGEIVLPPRVVQERREELEAMNRLGLLARKMGGMVGYKNEGGMWDRQVFLRKLLEEVQPGSRDEAIILKKLGIDPVTYKQGGGTIQGAAEEVSSLADKAAEAAGTAVKAVQDVASVTGGSGGSGGLIAAPSLPFRNRPNLFPARPGMPTQLPQPPQLDPYTASVAKDAEDNFWAGVSQPVQEPYRTPLNNTVIGAGGIRGFNQLQLNKGGPVYRQEGGYQIPEGALGQLGQSLVHIGQRDFGAASDALKAPARDKAAAKELKTTEERAQALKESIDAASKAKQYVEQGASVVINHKAKSFSELIEDFDVSGLLGLGAAAISGERDATVYRALHEKFGGTKEWNAYELFDQEVKLLELKARSLVKGGSISDNEAAAAAKTIITGAADSNTVLQQLDTVINRNNTSLTNLGMQPYKSTAVAHVVSGTPYQESKEIIHKEVEVPVDQLQDGQKFKDPSDYIYTYIKERDVVHLEGYGEYPLNYDPNTQNYWIKGSDGYSTYVLTPVMEG